MPYARWEARIQNPNAYTIIAHKEVTLGNIMDQDTIEQCREHSEELDEGCSVCADPRLDLERQETYLTQHEWIGMNTLICENHQDSQPLKCHVVGLFVHPDLRDKGIGTRLMESAVSLAQNLAKDVGAFELLINLSVYSANSKAFDIYRSLGFQIEDSFSGEDGSVNMVKRVLLDEIANIKCGTLLPQ